MMKSAATRKYSPPKKFSMWWRALLPADVAFNERNSQEKRADICLDIRPQSLQENYRADAIVVVPTLAICFSGDFGAAKLSFTPNSGSCIALT